jgi:hypothetical protein
MHVYEVRLHKNKRGGRMLRLPLTPRPGVIEYRRDAIDESCTS